MEVNASLRLFWINLARGCHVAPRPASSPNPGLCALSLHWCARAAGPAGVIFPFREEPRLPGVLPPAVAPGGGGLSARRRHTRLSTPPSLLLLPKSELGTAPDERASRRPHCALFPAPGWTQIPHSYFNSCCSLSKHIHVEVSELWLFLSPHYI